MRIFFLCICLIWSLMLFSQSQTGLKLNIGLSKTPMDYNPTMNTSTVTNNFSPSFTSGAFYNYHFHNSYIGTELLYSFVSGSEGSRMDFTESPDNIVGYSSYTLVRRYSYIAVPVYYGFGFGKLSFNLGAQAGYMVVATGIEKGKAVYYDQVSEFNNRYSGVYMKRINYGPRGAVFYRLNNRFSLEGSFYYGLNNIAKVGSWEHRIFQAVGGIRYSFFARRKNAVD